MSRAFVKDAEGVDELPDRPISDHPNEVTREGLRQIEAALTAARPFARFALCGMISQYNNTDLGEGVRGLVMAVGKSIALKGFIVSNHTDMQGAFVKDLSQWTAAGKIKARETVKQGIENAPAAFLGLFKGENLGKMLVKLG